MCRSQLGGLYPQLGGLYPPPPGGSKNITDTHAVQAVSCEHQRGSI